MSTFVDKLSSLFDRSFVLAFWVPTLAALILSVSVATAVIGPVEIAEWWQERSVSEQLALSAAAFVVMTITAHVLQALVVPVVQLYEGYWPPFAKRLTRWARYRQMLEWEKIPKPDGPYSSYPKLASRVMPTRLGNVLVAPEDHVAQLYSMNAPLWWPRLAVLLPPALNIQIDAAVTPMLALLNLSTMFALTAILGGAVVWWFDERWAAFLVVFLGGFTAALLCYRAAVVQARGYADLIRVAFDLHRFEILKNMRLPLPDNLSDEMRLWAALEQRFFRFRAPWNTDEVANLDMLKEPFFYDFHGKAKPDKAENLKTAVKQFFH